MGIATHPVSLSNCSSSRNEAKLDNSSQTHVIFRSELKLVSLLRKRERDRQRGRERETAARKMIR